MFYIKSDDIEELFREAAEKYQIDTEAAAAWDDVRDAVHSNDQPAQPPPPDDKRKRRWLSLGWLLLIPLGWFAHNVWNNINEPKGTQKQEVQAVAPAGKTATADNKPQQNQDDNKAKQNTGSANTGDANKNTGDNKAIAGAGKKEDNTGVSTGNQKAITEKPPYKNNGSLSIKTGIAQIGHAKQIPANNSIVSNKRGTEKLIAEAGKENSGVNNSDKGKNDKTGIVENEASKKNNPPVVALPGSNPVAEKPADAQPAGNRVAANNTPAKMDSTIAANGEKNGKKPKVPQKNEHYFYTGFTIAPDVSFIHFQKTSAVGIGGGILLGYHFNNRLSVETGLLFDRKNYFTSNNHFDKDRIPFFKNNPDAILHSVDGNCNMFEIPVNLKYSFILKNKSALYGIAGVSSYLMGHEYYEFDYTQWGTDYAGGRPYDNHEKSWFSIINLGLGYERKLGAKTNLRIEPYIKVPLSGAGTGNISITSTGLYLGVTRRIP